MGQDRQEVVLAAIGFAQRVSKHPLRFEQPLLLFGPSSLCGVAAHRLVVDGTLPIIEERANSPLFPPALARARADSRAPTFRWAGWGGGPR